MKIAAIIPTFNRKEKLDIILTQLCTQKGTDDIKLEIIVCVDGSSDGTDEMIKKKFPLVHTVSGDGNWWYTKSMNMGFQYAQQLNPDFVLTLNDDVEVDNYYVSILLTDFLSIGRKDIVLGSLSVSNDERRLVHFAGSKQNGTSVLSVKNYFPPLEMIYDRVVLSGIHPSRELAGRGILIPNALLVNLNYFDESLPQYGSDTDFCLKVRKSGGDVLISWNAIVKVNVGLTRIRSESGRESLRVFLKDLFDKHSHYSIRKFILLEYRYANPVKLIWKVPFFLGSSVWGIVKRNKARTRKQVSH